jgi:hypothetical protein
MRGTPVITLRHHTHPFKNAHLGWIYASKQTQENNAFIYCHFAKYFQTNK